MVVVWWRFHNISIIVLRGEGDCNHFMQEVGHVGAIEDDVPVMVMVMTMMGDHMF
jgi:hypothetical protein